MNATPMQTMHWANPNCRFYLEPKAQDIYMTQRMQQWQATATGLSCLLLAALICLFPLQLLAQTDAPPVPGPVDRLPDGKPDLSGNWGISANLSDITASIVKVGDVEVEGEARNIPYTPVYAQLRAETRSRMYEEPELHCYMPGVPSFMWRQAYSGAGLVIQHNESYIVFLHEFQGARRIVEFDKQHPLPEHIKLFMGDGSAHWDGETLEIVTGNHNAITWLDLAGNRHSDQLVVTERFTPINNNSYHYEATFVDAEAYTMPWTIAATMTRGSDPRAEILEFACIEGNTDHLHYTEDVGGFSPITQ
jgi:hypothetical protein